MRERLTQTILFRLLNGITPACAGKTPIAMKNSLSFQDHPRVCGKDSTVLAHLFHNLGSPPRVRERLIQRYKSHMIIRITPACAGKTAIWCADVIISWDHPRVCGKDPKNPINPRIIAGSPPRVRERPDWAQGLVEEAGITPACAGKTEDDARCIHAD